MVTSKAALRRTANTRRRTRGAGAALDDVLAPLLAEAGQVASYVALPGEPSVVPRRGWLLPVLLDGDLDWSVYDGRLAAARLGLQEPVGPRLGVGAISRCDLVLVPALLVDRRGHRLGKGGGSYDRVLHRAGGLTVALLHDDELVDALPSAPHDVTVDAVATPSLGVVRFRAR
jgi:5-formyltetrahydrofolate cyclo-ligase